MKGNTMEGRMLEKLAGERERHLSGALRGFAPHWCLRSKFAVLVFSTGVRKRTRWAQGELHERSGLSNSKKMRPRRTSCMKPPRHRSSMGRPCMQRGPSSAARKALER